jgi:hypothetical protein
MEAGASSSTVKAMTRSFTREEREAFVRWSVGTLRHVKLYRTRRKCSIAEPGAHAGIVLSNTGSGKTESLLSPILASIARKARRSWVPPEAEYLTRRWWRDASYESYGGEGGIPEQRRLTSDARGA